MIMNKVERLKEGDKGCGTQGQFGENDEKWNQVISYHIEDNNGARFSACNDS